MNKIFNIKQNLRILFNFILIGFLFLSIGLACLTKEIPDYYKIACPKNGDLGYLQGVFEVTKKQKTRDPEYDAEYFEEYELRSVISKEVTYNEKTYVPKFVFETTYCSIKTLNFFEAVKVKLTDNLYVDHKKTINNEEKDLRKNVIMFENDFKKL